MSRTLLSNIAMDLLFVAAAACGLYFAWPKLSEQYKQLVEETERKNIQLTEEYRHK